jgi:hypothetical protein
VLLLVVVVVVVNFCSIIGTHSHGDSTQHTHTWFHVRASNLVDPARQRCREQKGLYVVSVASHVNNNHAPKKAGTQNGL